MSQEDTQDILARRDLRRDIVDRIIDALVVVRGNRIQALRADAPSVQRGLVESKARDGERGFPHGAIQAEALLEGRRIHLAAKDHRRTPRDFARRTEFPRARPGGIRDDAAPVRQEKREERGGRLPRRGLRTKANHVLANLQRRPGIDELRVPTVVERTGRGKVTCRLAPTLPSIDLDKEAIPRRDDELCRLRLLREDEPPLENRRPALLRRNPPRRAEIVVGTRHGVSANPLRARKRVRTTPRDKSRECHHDNPDKRSAHPLLPTLSHSLRLTPCPSAPFRGFPQGARGLGPGTRSR